MVDSERPRQKPSWKLSASLLGVIALLSAGIAGNLIDLTGPWQIAIPVAVIVTMLVGGTFWLVPDGGARASRRTNTEDPHG